MEVNYWFEVYITNEDESTETIESFDTENEALEFITSNNTLKLDYDKWTTDEVGNNVKIY
jgi:hypothetical protein